MMPLVHSDPHLAPALASWLAGIGVAEKGLSFPVAAEHCVSLCKVVVMFAPHLMSENDFFVPSKVVGNTAVRQRRYNTRRLARSLAQWFDIDFPSSSNDDPSQQLSPNSSINLSPSAKERIKCITEAAISDQNEHEPDTVMLLLGEVLLCAAVNSPSKNMFVESILNLRNEHQEALADSIRRTTAEDLDEHSNTVLMEKQAPASQQDVLVAPRDIPLADFKALAEERDVLRRRCTAAETEKDAVVQTAANLRRDLEDAGDRLRVVLGSLAEKEAELEQKNVSLIEARSVVRDISLSAEEVDVLRAQAASSKKFETSLKRASKRLEEAGNMRETINQLETQNSALRDSETRANNQLHFLEGQLKASTERAENMAKLSEGMSLELDAKKNEIQEILSMNTELEQKLETANKQLASMLVMSEDGSPRKLEASEGNTNEQKPAEFDPQLVSAKLFETLGVTMQWSDVVDCVRGVVEAMNEMDAHHLGDGEPHSDSKMSSSGFSRNSSGVSAGDPNTFSASSYSMESQDSMDGNTQPEVTVLPNFTDVDSKREANKTSENDLFDYAVDHANVTEVLTRRPSQLSTVPEDREGFEDDDIPETYEPGPVEEPVAETRDISGNTKPLDQIEQDVGVTNPVGMEVTSAHTVATDLAFSSANADRLSVSIRPTGKTSQEVVRQTRSEILSLQKTLNALHADHATSTLHALVTQLDEAREEANRMRVQIQEKETECDTLRHDLDSLIKEHDATLREHGERRETASSMLAEKERVIKLLENVIGARDAELKALRDAAAKAEETILSLQEAAALRAAAAKETTLAARANEVEIARLKARLEAAEMIAGKLGKAMDRTDGLTGEIHRARESYFQDLAESARREKEAANSARAEAQQAAEENAQALVELKQAQRASQRPPSVCCSDVTRNKARRANRIGTFWRRMLHRDAGSFDHAEAQGAHTLGGGVPPAMRMRPASVGPAAAARIDPMHLN